ncbi:MAG: tRNA dihydrouridine synthase DusB [Clostridiaceae bacterium]|nr:tRNA dihydrouridine synthase DusB [Clostridiaceae bacterium]MDY5889141.1 tRNA dihydrouridine synthase DusB [Oscillospiraceae bacterium]
MKIGNLEIKGHACLAPMAGVADRAFRELCVSYGASCVISEMVSSKGLTMQDRKSKELLFLSEKERPAGAQIFGDDPEIMAKAALKAMEFSPDFIDINMGCPAPKIAGNGGGSALLKNPELIGRIVKSVVEVSPVPVTAKIRIGWDSEHINAVEVAKRIEAAGASAITVHGRTKAQMYAPPVFLDEIAKVKKSVSIPVIGNGDIVDGKSAKKMLDETGCDFLMVGRGALGNPWIFRCINAYLNNETEYTEPTLEEKMEVMLTHIGTLCEYKGTRVGMREARKHAAWYIKGIRGAASFRQEIGNLSSMDELSALAERVIDSQR